MPTGVEYLMKQVREVTDKSFFLGEDVQVETGPVYFITADYLNLYTTLGALKGDARIRGEFVIGASKGKLGWTKNLVKRVIRKLISWYTEPMIQQISDFNVRVARVLNTLAEDQKRISYTFSRGVKDETQRAFGNLLEDTGWSSKELTKDLYTTCVHIFEGCKSVLDVGCGRGEFLKLLKEKGIDARGVDREEGSVEACQQENLQAFRYDELSYLRSLKDNSLDGIFVSQFAEQLNPNELIELVDLSHKKLEIGGQLAVLAPNPQSLSAYLNYLYTNLAERRPVHPSVLKFLAERAGFKESRIGYLAEVEKEARLSSVKVPDNVGEGEKKQWENLANNTEKLNLLLYGPQFYVLTARK